MASTRLRAVGMRPLKVSVAPSKLSQDRQRRPDPQCRRVGKGPAVRVGECVRREREIHLARAATLRRSLIGHDRWRRCRCLD